MRLATIKLHGAEVAGIVTGKGILPVAALGGRGVISVLSNLAPAAVSAMAHAAVATAMPAMSTPVCGEVALASVVAPVTVEESTAMVTSERPSVEMVT